jgi:hypothetical protein
MTASEPNSPPFAEIYIDESSTQHRYLVIGGIVVPLADSAAFIESIQAARLPELPRDEMKWTKVSRSKLSAYVRVVDAFFAHTSGTLDFHSVVIDTTKQKHRVYNQGSREAGFNKEVYQLTMKFGRLYRALFHVYPDYRETNQRPSDLRLMLNQGIRLKGDKRDWPFRRLQFRDSKKTLMLQLADVFAGALAYHLNGHKDALDASPAKIELSAYILRKARIVNVFNDTAVRGKFTVWHRKLR